MVGWWLMKKIVKERVLVLDGQLRWQLVNVVTKWTRFRYEGTEYRKAEVNLWPNGPDLRFKIAVSGEPESAVNQLFWKTVERRPEGDN